MRGKEEYCYDGGKKQGMYIEYQLSAGEKERGGGWEVRGREKELGKKRREERKKKDPAR